MLYMISKARHNRLYETEKRSTCHPGAPLFYIVSIKTAASAAVMASSSRVSLILSIVSCSALYLGFHGSMLFLLDFVSQGAIIFLLPGLVVLPRVAALVGVGALARAFFVSAGGPGWPALWVKCSLRRFQYSKGLSGFAA